MNCDHNSSSDSGQGSLDQEPETKGGETEGRSQGAEERKEGTEEKRGKRRGDRKPSVTISEDGSKYGWRTDPVLSRYGNLASFA